MPVLFPCSLRLLFPEYAGQGMSQQPSETLTSIGILIANAIAMTTNPGADTQFQNMGFKQIIVSSGPHITTMFVTHYKEQLLGHGQAGARRAPESDEEHSLRRLLTYTQDAERQHTGQS